MSYTSNPVIVAPAQAADAMAAYRAKLERMTVMVQEIAEDGQVGGLTDATRADLGRLRDEVKRLAEAASALDVTVSAVIG